MTFSRNDLGEKTILRIEGSLDAVSTKEIRAVFDALVAEKRMAVTVDLSRLRQIDSSAVGAIVSLRKRIRGQDGR
jgi:anti-anti-sigma factor